MTLVITEADMVSLKVTRIGNSVGVILPKEVLALLRVEQGDTLFVTETANGVMLTPYDPQFEEQMTAARRIMKKRRGVLRELAK
jgi:putative addiction module antidote